MSKQLYSRFAVSNVAVGDETYEGDEEGKFDLPDHIADQLHAVHLNGEKAWETWPEKYARLEEERLQRRRDPAALLDAVEQLAERTDALEKSPETPRSASDVRAQIKALQDEAKALDAEEKAAIAAEKAAAKAPSTPTE